MIGKRHGLVADDLTRLMALACNDQHIARTQAAHGKVNRMATITDFNGIGSRRQNGRADGFRFLRARVVVGDIYNVGKLGGDVAHLRTLARIAVAAAAKDDDKLAVRMRAQKRR